MTLGSAGRIVALAPLAELRVRVLPGGAVRLEIGHDEARMRHVDVKAGDRLEVEFGSGLAALIGFGRVSARRLRGTDACPLVDHSVDLTLDGEFDDRLATELEDALGTAARFAGAHFATTRAPSR
jgi:hypothetical protein